MIFQVIICFEQNRKLPIDVCKQEKDLAITPVKQLKDKIQERRPYTEKAKMGLIYKTKTLEDDQPLVDYGIKHKSEIHVVMRCDGGLDLIVPLESMDAYTRLFYMSALRRRSSKTPPPPFLLSTCA